MSISAPIAKAKKRATQELTEKEMAVVHLIAQGLTYAEIAFSLQLCFETIKGRVARIRAKLGLKSKTQIALWAVNQQVSRNGRIRRPRSYISR